MNEILTFQNITYLVFIIIYATIFVIQKSQFTKQKEIIEKYEKMFSIIKIDEIEKYVELQKKNTELTIQNKVLDLENQTDNLNNISKEIDKILKSSKSNLEKSNEISQHLHNHLNQSKEFVEDLYELNIAEFKEFYEIISEFKNIKPKEYSKIETKLLKNVEKYDRLKREKLKKL